ncbi:MAG: hypothetical protein AAGI15_07360 [Pseudomonadota bacterium]
MNVTTDKTFTVNGTATLAGIVSLPPKAQRNPELPMVLFLNSGILHRIGASRLHVKFSRIFAQLGYSSIRFDHSSLGDSGARRGTATFEETARAEVREIMDYAQKHHGAHSFMIFGLCSGADIGHQVAVQDERIVSLIEIDPWTFTTTRSQLRMLARHFGPRIFKASKWLAFFKRKLGLQQTTSDDSPARDEWYADPEYVRHTPAKSEIAGEFQALMARNVCLYLCYSGCDYYGTYNYEGQFQDAFPQVDFGDRVRVEWVQDSTHLITALDHQQLLEQTIVEWLRETGQLPAADTTGAAQTTQPTAALARAG